jgi:hypothetical protein
MHLSEAGRCASLFALHDFDGDRTFTCWHVYEASVTSAANNAREKKEKTKA